MHYYIVLKITPLIQEETFSMCLTNMVNLYHITLQYSVAPCKKSQNVKFIYRVKKEVLFSHFKTIFFLSIFITISQGKKSHFILCVHQRQGKCIHIGIFYWWSATFCFSYSLKEKHVSEVFLLDGEECLYSVPVFLLVNSDL